MLTLDKIEAAMEATALGLPTPVQVYSIRKAKATNTAEVESNLATLLTWAINRTSVKNNFTTDQMYDFVATIAHDPEYNWMSLEHIALAIHNGYKGHYGPIYERFDLPMLLSWLGKLTHQRTEKVERDRYNQHLKTKEHNPNDRPTNFFESFNKNIQ